MPNTKTIKIFKAPEKTNDYIALVAKMMTQNACGPHEEDYQQNYNWLLQEFIEVLEFNYDPTKPNHIQELEKGYRKCLFERYICYKYKYPKMKFWKEYQKIRK